MPIETEIKLRCPDHAAARAALERAGAVPLGRVMETNTFFDTGDERLTGEGVGLRVRRKRRLDESADDKFVVTYKGPRRASSMKSREELEFGVLDGDAAAAVFDRLGFAPRLTFEKVRESWRLDDCAVELDTLPRLGTFVEIEGPDEDAVHAARTRLGWDKLDPEPQAYSAMVAATGQTTLRFE